MVSSYEKADADVAEAGKLLAGKYPVENAGRGFSLMPLEDVAMGPYIRTQLLRICVLLMSAAGLLLLIAIANVGNALLAGAAVRRREMAVRIALGATSRQLLGQVFWDSVVVVAAGGLLGFLLGVGGRNLLWSLRPESWPQQVTPHLNWRILAFVAVLSLITGLLGNLLPAWQTLRGNITRELRERAEGGRSGQPRYRLRETLVVSQVALLDDCARRRRSLPEESTQCREPRLRLRNAKPRRAHHRSPWARRSAPILFHGV